MPQDLPARAAGEIVHRPPSSPPPNLLQCLLAGVDIPDLPPLLPDEAPDLTNLESPSRAAIGLALRTPDVALVHGAPAPVVAETIAAAIRLGERVLLIAHDGSVLDRVVGQLAGHRELQPPRRVEPGESESTLPAGANGAFAGSARQSTDRTAAAYEQLLALAEQFVRLRGSGNVLSREGEPRRLARQETRPPAVAEIERLRPLAMARAAGHWWTVSWWRAVFAGDVIGRLADLESKQKQAEAEAVAREGELTVVADKWQQALRQLPADSPRPDALSADAVTAARDDWGRSCAADGEDSDFNLVTTTPAGFAAERHRGPFDLLVMADAHAVVDSDLFTLAGCTRRWVLFGEPLSASGFARLWGQLHCDPWVRDGDRIVCRLRPLPASCRLDREPVADRPDVVLGIHTPRDGKPELAEVAFPPGTPIAQAVEFVFRELGELPASQGPDCPAIIGNQNSVLGTELGGGVRAVISATPAGWDIASIAFDPSTWDPERAAAWVRRQVVRPQSGRTLRLESST
jgi:hypothetical protein